MSQPELFTFQVQGKGIRVKARVPGWVAALLIRFAKENEATPESDQDSVPKDVA